MWIGYARADMIPQAEHRRVGGALSAYASHYGLGEGRVVFEPLAPELLLRDMLAELDRRDPAAAVMGRLGEVARWWDVDLARLFTSSRRADALWQLLETMQGAAGAHLIVASRAHLARLDPSGRAALSRLTQMRTVGVHYLDAASAETRPPDLHPANPQPDVQVLVESRVGAIPAVAQLDAASVLTGLGRTEMLEVVDAAYVALINDADTGPGTAEATGSLSGGSPTYIRLLAADGRLIAELEEPRARPARVAASVALVCESTQRYSHDGRTFTRCVLPVATPLSEVSGGRR